MASDYDTNDLVTLRVGSNRTVQFVLNEPEDVVTVDSVTVEAAANVSPSGNTVVDGNTVSSDFDMAGAVPANTYYEVCLHVTFNSGSNDVFKAPLLVKEGC